MIDPDDPTDPDIDLPWLIVGVCAAVVMAICAAAERLVRAGRRAVFRARARLGVSLIDVGARLAPAPPVRPRTAGGGRGAGAALMRAHSPRRNGKAKGPAGGSGSAAT